MQVINVISIRSHVSMRPHRCKASQCVRHMHAQGAPKRQRVCARHVSVRAPIHAEGVHVDQWRRRLGEGHVRVT